MGRDLCMYDLMAACYHDCKVCGPNIGETCDNCDAECNLRQPDGCPRGCRVVENGKDAK